MKLVHELRVDRDHCRLVLHGEIDLRVRDELFAVLHHPLVVSHSVIEVDLQDVTFMDCTGVGVLFAASNTGRRDGRAVYVSHASGIVRRAMEITGVLTRPDRAVADPHLVATASSATRITSGRATGHRFEGHRDESDH